MTIDRRNTQKQLNLIRQKLNRRWQDRYPTYQHQKDRPIVRPKLVCRISDMKYENAEVIVRARISNTGSGASYHTKVNFLYGVLAPVILVPIGSPVPAPPPPPPVHEQLQLRQSQTIAVHPGQEQELVFKVPQPFVINTWQTAVLCYDPVSDPLPMATWHQHLLPMDNLLQGAYNPPQSAPIPHWEEYDSPTATQPRTTNRTWHGRSASPEPHPIGSSIFGIPNPTYFAPGNAAQVSELRQTVSVSQFSSLIANGDALFRLAGWVRSYDQSPTDRSQIIVECLANNNVALAELDLGQHTNTQAWRQLVGAISAPAGTTRIRVRLRSTRFSGTNNDGYFDHITLTPAHRQIAAADRWSFG